MPPQQEQPVRGASSSSASTNACSYAPVPTTNEPSPSRNNENENGREENAAAEPSKPPKWRVVAFAVLLAADLLVSLLLLLPVVPGIAIGIEGQSKSFQFHSSLVDMGGMAGARVLLAVAAMIASYCRGLGTRPEFETLDPRHPNGEKKTREELEREALEEPLGPWLRRFAARPSFGAEVVSVVAQGYAVAKCLARMNVEIGILEDKDPKHPWFWIACLLTTVISCVETTYLDDVCQVAGECGKRRIATQPASLRRAHSSAGLLRRIGSQLTIPLLSGLQSNEEEESGDVEQGEGAEAHGENPTGGAPPNPEDVRGVSDITGDSNYKATWKDLLATCYPDAHLIGVAFVFLLLAAIAQVFIPKFLGKILDALTSAFANDSDDSRHKSMFEIPGFLDNVKLLVVASVLAGVFAGIRGSIFTVVGARVNVRLRIQLMDSLLAQDIGFFDVTKTGDITSRLSSDTTLVGDQVSLNVNVFLRSLVQAIGVLLFMFLVSWQLSILAFISVPLITLFSKWYGEYIRSLTKLMQKKLADGNSGCEAALSSMATVRVFDAAEAELAEFEKCMKNYLQLNTRSAIAYFGYATFVTSLPQLVFAVVVFYGGLLVRNGDITSGQLVSFLLYLSSLSDAFSSIGYVFSSLTQAVGAADKVFELMHRKPRLTRPTRSDPAPPGSEQAGVLGIPISRTREQRSFGLWPESCRGGIEFQNVELYYPARPQRKVLNGLSLSIPPGSVIALVGESGGGKSSVTNLIEHLYEQSSGQVLIDGTPVHELAPSWLSKHISIVSQTPTLFGRSIRRNIMYGLEGTPEEPSQEEIEAAARLANADKFIENMPQKYDTEVGERGVQLSGGQRQRIAIARALVRKPKILLLDEATSALDAESEHFVQQAIDDMLSRGKSEMTVIIIAHRLSTVRSADSIMVIKNGNVVEEGSHEVLISDPDGVYASLIRRQLETQRKLDSSGVESSFVSSNDGETNAADATTSFFESEPLEGSASGD